MSGQKTFTLPKGERLCSKTLIDQLFLGHSTRKKEWPIQVVYQVVRRDSGLDAPVEMMVSVSKRHFKRAVKRNLVKRQLRESYRLHKSLLTDAFSSHPDAKLLIAFIWMTGNVKTTEEVEGAMVKVLSRVLDSLEFQDEVTSESPRTV